MAITQANLKAKLVAYINRTAAEMVVGTYDLALDAMNMAKLRAQRRHNFKMNRSSGFVATNIVGTAMSNITSDYAGNTKVTWKYIESMWTVFSSGSTYYRGNRVPAMTVGDQKLLHGVATETDYLWPATLPPNVATTQSQSLRWFQNGLTICVNGVFPPNTQTFWVDGIAYLPDYDGTSGTDDFFLTYHHDWLFYASLQHLNMFLKEDQRIQINVNLMEQMWNDVVAYDESFSESAFDIDLSN